MKTSVYTHWLHRLSTVILETDWIKQEFKTHVEQSLVEFLFLFSSEVFKDGKCHLDSDTDVLWKEY